MVPASLDASDPAFPGGVGGRRPSLPELLEGSCRPDPSIPVDLVQVKSRCDLQSWVCLSTIDPSGHSQPYHVTLNSWMRNGKKARMRAGHWQSPPSIGSLHRGTGQASCALPTQHWPVLNPRLPWLEASCGWPLPTMHMLTLKLWGPSCTPFPTLAHPLRILSRYFSCPFFLSLAFLSSF